VSGIPGDPRGLDLAASYWLAAGCLIVFLVVLWSVCRTKIYSTAQGQKTRRRFWYIVLGADDRVSTSKVQLVLWTLALAYALLVIAFHDAVFPPGNLDPRYLLLLGFPAGAAVGAKAITTGQMASGTVVKNPPAYEKKTLPKALSDIVSNDQGDLDLGDTQYFLFTLVTLTAFFIGFFRSPTTLPALPDTLVGLSSASAAAYVAKKATSSAPMTITAVSPQKGPAGTTAKVYGSNLGNPASGTGPPDVTMGGLTATVQGSWSGTVVPVAVPPGLPLGTVEVQVITPEGLTATLPAAFEVTV
jgi:hypothetical protein